MKQEHEAQKKAILYENDHSGAAFLETQFKELSANVEAVVRKTELDNSVKRLEEVFERPEPKRPRRSSLEECVLQHARVAATAARLASSAGEIALADRCQTHADALVLCMSVDSAFLSEFRYPSVSHAISDRTV